MALPIAPCPEIRPRTFSGRYDIRDRRENVGGIDLGIDASRRSITNASNHPDVNQGIFQDKGRLRLNRLDLRIFGSLSSRYEEIKEVDLVWCRISGRFKDLTILLAEGSSQSIAHTSNG